MPPLLASCALLFFCAPVLAARLNAVRVGDHDEYLRVVLDFDEHPPRKVLLLSEPDRLVIDLARTNTRVSPPAIAPGGIVERIRLGEHSDRRLRVVLDLGQGLADYRVFALDGEGGRPPRLVVDLTPSSAGSGAVSGGAEPQDSGPAVAAGAPASERADASGRLARSELGPGEGEAVAGKYLRVPPPAAVAPEDALIRGPEAAAVPAQEVPEAATPEREQQTQADPSQAPPAAEGVSRAPAAGAGRSTRAREARDGPAIDIDFSGTWEHEWAWGTERSDAQKFETLLEPRMDLSFPGGATVTTILRFRGDTVGELGPFSSQVNSYSDASAPWVNDEHGAVELRELYLDLRTGPVDWRIGKQQVVWGQADGIKVLDVVNPQSFREFILDDFDDSRIPLWTLNASVRLGGAGDLQLLWIPDTTYHELAEFGATYELTSPRLLPPLPVQLLLPVDKPDDPFGDADFGAQWSAFLGGWDVTLNYLYQYLDIPALPVLEVAPGVLALAPEYRRSHLVGGTFSTALGPFTLRGELAWNSDSLQPIPDVSRGAVFESSEFSSVLGIDYLAGSDLLLSAQWFQSTLEDSDRLLARSATDQTVSLLYQQDFANAAWRLRALALHNLDDEDSLMQLKLKYWLTGTVQVWVGADYFFGSERGLFGQYDRNDRIVMGFEYGF